MNIPKSIQNVLPQAGQKMYADVYKKSFSKHGDDVLASNVAWAIVKSRFQKQDQGFVAMDSHFKPVEMFKFDVEAKDELLIKNGEDGEVIVEGVLADTSRNTEGKYFAEEDLMSIAEQINKFGSTYPDVEHEKLNEVYDMYFNNPQKVLSELKTRKGLFTSIKAIYEKGKLWIKAHLDKRYKNHISKFRGLSIEAFGKSLPDGRVTNPIYAGFTFTNTPKLKAAQLV